MVALTQTGLRILHFVGACGRVPGLHFRNFIRYGDKVPASHDFDKACKTCFGKKGVVAVPQTSNHPDSDDDDDDDDETESSSSR